MISTEEYHKVRSYGPTFFLAVNNDTLDDALLKMGIYSDVPSYIVIFINITILKGIKLAAD